MRLYYNILANNKTTPITYANFLWKNAQRWS